MTARTTDTTLDYYNQHAQEFVASTLDVDMSALYDAFLPLFANKIPNQTLILDAGCGSGRDALYFKKQGYFVRAMDASPALVDIAASVLNQPVALKTFTEIDDVNTFDGIWCCASLLHVPHNELAQVFNKLTTALKTEGVLYVSFKYGEGERTHNGRTFTDLNEQGLAALKQPIPELNIHKTWITGDQRKGRENEQWLNAILIKSGRV
ncbi:class I SAM-dependent methyltransferase [Pseudoalteromonas tunicata]|uniref:Tellurite resistance protein-related protein n=1 Tax=Pseudoalteromonas tunicata D2 TaxID=87626 RepID=A4C9Y2_9GAMM|nr:class I SAM-dependent methyltransferase [Pseudoalteromonas tunicata]ATC94739.1 hypothetical protein PTUN_a2224 [Pseudoalteromonas tunicata]AXT30445.1 class I SAM-dependent methyltransferase [Pseudoalteromonas tunicata]EAR28190.1 tellurite resistance protein-related protein [Pseudoalteromonas tunicata D2]